MLLFKRNGHRSALASSHVDFCHERSTRIVRRRRRTFTSCVRYNCTMVVVVTNLGCVVVDPFTETVLVTISSANVDAMLLFSEINDVFFCLRDIATNAM